MSSQRAVFFIGCCSIGVLPCSLACGGSTATNHASGGSAQSSGGASASGGVASGGVAGTGVSSGGATSVGGASGGGVAIGPGGGGGYSGGGAFAGGTGGASAGTGGAIAGAGGAIAGAGGAIAGAGGSSGCSGLSQTRSSRTAKSSGFSGSYETDYYPLYSHACTVLADCSAACVSAGGTVTSCAASECITSTPNYCLPPTYWFGLDQLLVEGNTIDSSAWIIMVDNPYRDTLSASNFQFEIPSGAKIHGLTFSFNESADSDDMVGDFSVHALSGGAPVGLDRGHSTAWTTTFHYEDYGGPSDLWGASWTADAVNAADFGVALTPMYLSSAGNARAYVDFIRATAYYDTCP